MKNLCILQDRQIAIMPGHEPGGGTSGEREWNAGVCNHLAKMLRAFGAQVFNYRHTISAYDLRQDAMRDAVNAELDNPLAVIELHYNAVDYASAHGHEFHYRGSESLARCFANAWQATFPVSHPRHDRGILYNPSSNGSGFLRKAPGWACLAEPFFNSNPMEKERYKPQQLEVAMTYCYALAAFAETRS